jgi:hypothetical protein
MTDQENKNNADSSVIGIVAKSALKELISSRAPIVLSVEGVEFSFLTYVKKVEGDSFYLHNSIPPKKIKNVLESKNSNLTLPDFSLFGGNLSGDGKFLIFTPNKKTEHSETRLEKRLSFEPGENVNIEFLNPIDNKTKFRKKVLDLSSSGLSFETHYDSKLFIKDEILEEIYITIADKRLKKCNGKIVYKKPLFDFEYRKRFQIGLKLENIEDLKND